MRLLPFPTLYNRTNGSLELQNGMEGYKPNDETKRESEFGIGI